MPRILRPLANGYSQRKWLTDKVKAYLVEVSGSFTWWVGATYKQNESKIVQDASPQYDLRKRIAELDKHWRERTDAFALEVSEQFVNRINNQTKASMLSALSGAGITLTIPTTSHLTMVYQAAVQRNVNLIKSLVDEFLTSAQDIIWNGVQYGHDLSYIKRELINQIGIEERRAARIAVDQSLKAAVSLNNARAEDIGIKYAYLVHNPGGSKAYRETHVEVAAAGQPHEIAVGFWDEAVGRYVQPAEEPFCKCTWRYIVDEAELKDAA